MRRTFPTVACILAALTLPVAAGADEKKKKKGDEDEPPPQAAEQMEWIQQGHAAYLVRDYDKALELYRQAGEKMPKSSAAHYFIGCALEALGEDEKAEESYRTAYLMATGSEQVYKGVALVKVALLLEKKGDLDEAKEAWEGYLEIASAKGVKPDLTSLAEKRIEAITAVLDLASAYEPVRERIEKQKEKEAEESSD